MNVRFTKMQAFGNDYVYIDAISQDLPNVNDLARFVSNRHFGIGSDGMVLVCPSVSGDFRMRIFNPDGSEAQMCGNALRSMSKYVYDFGLTKKTELSIETLGGMQTVWLTVKDNRAINIRADIGCPRFTPGEIPVNTKKTEFFDESVQILDRTFQISAVGWGNPHVAVFVDALEDFDVEKYGRAIEEKTELFPEKTNVTFAVVKNRKEIFIREWERNCGETIGCGTGCCTAAVVAMRKKDCDREVTVHQIGGPLHVLWDEATDHVFMTGPSHVVFTSEIDTEYMEA